MFKHLFITGNPRVGKTTLVKKVIRETIITNPSFCIKGFVTNEVRLNSRRIGFDLETLEGETGILARIDKYKKFRSELRVGSYFVNLNDLERFIELFYDSSDILVIDEIGKMELYSDKFIEAVNYALENRNIFGTLGKTNHSLISSVLQRNDTKIIELTKSNRQEMESKAIKLLIDLLTG